MTGKIEKIRIKKDEMAKHSLFVCAALKIVIFFTFEAKCFSKILLIFSYHKMNEGFEYYFLTKWVKKGSNLLQAEL